MAHDIKLLVGKLNGVCREALEGAAELCVAETNYHVEIEHFFTRLIEADDSDLKRVLLHFRLRPEDVLTELRATLDGSDPAVRGVECLQPAAQWRQDTVCGITAGAVRG